MKRHGKKASVLEVSYIIGGVVIIVICFFVQGISCLLSVLGIIALLLVIDVFYTYKIAQTR